MAVFNVRTPTMSNAMPEAPVRPPPQPIPPATQVPPPFGAVSNQAPIPVQEVFAVTVIGRRFLELINDDEKLLESSFVIPTECLGDVAATVRAAGPA
jgi:hypothetical protein